MPNAGGDGQIEQTPHSCWQDDHPGSEPKSNVWLKNTTFTFFDIDTTGTMPKAVEVTMTGKDVIDTLKQLGYKYDNNCQNFELPALAPGPAPFPLVSSVRQNRAIEIVAGNALTAITATEHTLAAAPVKVSISLSPKIQKRIAALMRAGVAEPSIFLTIGGLNVDQMTAASYSAYLNVPDGVAPDSLIAS